MNIADALNREAGGRGARVGVERRDVTVQRMQVGERLCRATAPRGDRALRRQHAQLAVT